MWGWPHAGAGALRENRTGAGTRRADGQASSTTSVEQRRAAPKLSTAHKLHTLTAHTQGGVCHPCGIEDLRAAAARINKRLAVSGLEAEACWAVLAPLLFYYTGACGGSAGLAGVASDPEAHPDASNPRVEPDPLEGRGTPATAWDSCGS